MGLQSELDYLNCTVFILYVWRPYLKQTTLQLI